MNKKGMELAINQIVILIIGIVIFGLGLMLVMKVMSDGDVQLDQANAQIKAQFERSLDSDQVVDIPNKNRNMQAGDLETFYLGIFNDQSLSEDSNHFMIIITPDNPNAKEAISYFNSETPGNVCGSDSICFDSDNILDNEIDSIPIVVTPKEASLSRDQYVFNVCVCYSEKNIDQYCKKVGGGHVDSCTRETVSTIENLYGFTTFSINVR